MAFWRKSDDPWDRKPDWGWLDQKKPKEPKENPVDSLKQWNEARKAAAKEREEAKRLPPETCPWCGKEMEQGYLITGRDTVQWHSGIYKFDFFRGLDSAGTINVLNEGSAFSGYYKTTWLCRDCKKAVFDMPEPLEAEDGFSARIEEYSKKAQEEEQGGD